MGRLPRSVIANKDDWYNAAKPLTTIIGAYINHPGIGTLLLGAFLVLKGYVLAKGDISIALGILRDAGLSTVVIGGLLSGLPILVGAMLAASIFNVLERWPMEKKRALQYFPLPPLIVVLLATIVLSLIVTPWPFMVAAVVVGLLLALIDRTSRSGRKWVRRSSVLAFLVTLFIAVYATIVMLYSVWLPHEELTIKNVNPSPVGYVLSDDPDGWITILLSRQHAIMLYRDMDVTKRQVCYRRPYNVFSKLTDATTVWQEITEFKPLKFLHAPTENSC
jgi:hypothetical protein